MNLVQPLKWILRVMGSSSLFALIFVAAPESWMESIYVWAGLGTLPQDPVFGYLARSTSAFYAMAGGLFWVLSFDPARHRPVLIYLGAAIVLLGVTLLAVDWTEGLPLLWTVWEGPFVVVFGIVLLSLSRRLEPAHRDAPDRAQAAAVS
jgi:hypothetical protein